MTIAKIKPLPVMYKPGVQSIQNSYAERGWNRQPGTAIGYPPLRLPNGKYATGLDENSDEVQRLRRMDPDEATRLSEEIKERRIRLELATGLDLSPNAKYYTDVYSTGNYLTGQVAEKVKLYDKENVFDFSDPFQEVQYWWVIQNKAIIAPSLSEWREGRCKDTVQFYIENSEVEVELVYKRNKSMVDAVQTLTKQDLATRRKVAKLMGLSVTEVDNELSVYNKLYDAINEGSMKNAKYKGQNSVDLFNRIANLSTSIMNAQYIVEQAIEFRIYTKRNGVVYEGESMIANTEEQLIDTLANSNRSQEYLALEIKIADKLKLRANIEGLDYLPTPTKSEVTVDKRTKAGKAALE